jgi:aryl-alcohol dehydrogenase (NADP+)
MTFGLQTDEAESHAILNRAFDAGINFIDTADIYPIGGTLETVGHTEEIIGRWLKGRRRQRVILATKAVGQTGQAPWDQGASRKHLLDAIDASLKRLGTDYVDLYQLHADDRATPLQETLEALDAIVRSGRARYIGVSNFLAYRLALALGRAEAKNLAKFVSVQPRYNLLFREVERELLPLAMEEGLGVISYNPLAGGLLTGKHKFDNGPMPGTRFMLGSAAGRYQDRYWHEREFRTVEALREAVADAGVSLATAAVTWVLSNPVITSAIIGVSRTEQLVEAFRAAEVELADTVKARFDALTVEYRYGDAAR